MIKKIIVTNYLGENLELDLMNPEKSGFTVKNITGLGPSKGVINTTDLSTNDGSMFNSARISERNIVMKLGFLWCPTIEEVRHKSYKFFPIKKKVSLAFETDTRTCKIEGYVEKNDPTIFSSAEGTQISIICPDPFFYSVDSDGNGITVFSGVESIFEFEFCNEGFDNMIEFGDIQNKTENVVYYEGDDETGLTITIYALGDVKNVKIYNSRTRETMRINTDKIQALTGSGIIARDEITICTVRRKKRVELLRDGKKYNILNCLDKNVDWFQLSKGDNVFAFDAEEGSTNLQFKITNDVIYEGI